jgi:hypothetical protein
MSRLDEAKAQVAYLELEDEFLKAKERFTKGNLSQAKYSEVKERFHAARSAWRESRQATAADGDAVVSPQPARQSASVNK